MRGLRELSDLSPWGCLDALGLPHTPGGESTLYSAEQNEARGVVPMPSKVRARAEAFGLDVEIVVRARRRKCKPPP